MKPTFEDGDYQAVDLVEAFSPDFKTERELCHFIERNIGDFSSDILGVELASYKREYSFGRGPFQKRIKHTRRIDFLVISKSGERIGVECKHPMYLSELTAAIGQCLGYMYLFELAEQPLDRMVIVSSKIDSTAPLIMARFSLPISFVVMDKNKFAVFRGASN